MRRVTLFGEYAVPKILNITSSVGNHVRWLSKTRMDENKEFNLPKKSGVIQEEFIKKVGSFLNTYNKPISMVGKIITIFRGKPTLKTKIEELSNAIKNNNSTDFGDIYAKIVGLYRESLSPSIPAAFMSELRISDITRELEILLIAHEKNQRESILSQEEHIKNLDSTHKAEIDKLHSRREVEQEAVYDAHVFKRKLKLFEEFLIPMTFRGKNYFETLNEEDICKILQFLRPRMIESERDMSETLSGFKRTGVISLPSQESPRVINVETADRGGSSSINSSSKRNYSTRIGIFPRIAGNNKISAEEHDKFTKRNGC